MNSERFPAIFVNVNSTMASKTSAPNFLSNFRDIKSLINQFHCIFRFFASDFCNFGTKTTWFFRKSFFFYRSCGTFVKIWFEDISVWRSRRKIRNFGKNREWWTKNLKKKNVSLRFNDAVITSRRRWTERRWSWLEFFSFSREPTLMRQKRLLRTPDWRSYRWTIWTKRLEWRWSFRRL